MDWISYLGHSALRLNGDTFESLDKSISINSENGISLFLNEMPFSKKYYSVWIRWWSDFNEIKSWSKKKRR